MLPASPPTLDSASELARAESIALEITISELLFRQLQTALDVDSTLSLDDLASEALALYLGCLSLSSTEAN